LTIDNIDVEATINEVKILLQQERSLSPALRAALNVLITLVSVLVNRLALNSRNSSKPPSTDPNRNRTSKGSSSNKPGGQNGHVGTTLQPVDDPDEVKTLPVDRSFLPKGKYRRVGFEKRQVIDLDIRRFVIEYQAEVLEDANGQRFVAAFPAGVSRPVQYGNGVKAAAFSRKH
jgi:transposase